MAHSNCRRHDKAGPFIKPGVAHRSGDRRWAACQSGATLRIWLVTVLGNVDDDHQRRAVDRQERTPEEP